MKIIFEACVIAILLLKIAVPSSCTSLNDLSSLFAEKGTGRLEIFGSVLPSPYFDLSPASPKAPFLVSNAIVFDVTHFGAKGDGIHDDSQAFKDTWEAVCSASGLTVFLVPHGRTFLVNVVVFHGPCECDQLYVQVNGTIIGSNKLNLWNCKETHGQSWIEFQHVNDLHIQGNGTIDGQGEIWWDKRYKNIGGGCHDAPTALVIRGCTRVMVTGLNFTNNPRVHIKLEHSRQVELSNLLIQAPHDSPNTDGIHIQNSQDVFIHGSIIGTGDDCISIGSGSSNISVDTIFCGPGHGISVGSLGKGESVALVENIRVNNVLLSGTTNGVRIKTWQGGKGHARNITFAEVYMNDVDRPIVINQYYCNNGHNCVNHTSAVAISNVTYKAIYGTSSREQAVKLACSETVPCTNLFLDTIDLFWGSDYNKTDSYCLNAKGKIRNRVFPSIPCLRHN